MAKGPPLNSSVLIEDYFSSSQTLYQQNTIRMSTPFKEANLTCQDKGFVWKGSLDSLKKFVCDDAKPTRQLDVSWWGSKGIHV